MWIHFEADFLSGVTEICLSGLKVTGVYGLHDQRNGDSATSYTGFEVFSDELQLSMITISVGSCCV